MIDGIVSVRVLGQLACITAAVAIAGVVLFRSNATSQRAFLALAAGGIVLLSVILVSQQGVLWSVPVDPPSYWPQLGELPHVLVGFAAVTGLLLVVIEIWRLIATLRRIQMLRTTTDESLARVVADVCSALGHRFSIRIAIDPRLVGPRAASLFGRTIVLPQHYCEWPETTLNAVIAHEVVHLARRDDAWLLLWRLLAKAYWFLPWMHWLPGRFLDAAEASCDDRASEACRDGVAYCEALAVAASATPASRRTDERELTKYPGAMAAISHGLLARVRRFLAPRRQDLDTHALYWAMLGVLVILPVLTSVQLTGAPETSSFLARVIAVPTISTERDLTKPNVSTRPRVSEHFFAFDHHDRLIPIQLESVRRPFLPIYPGDALRMRTEADVWTEFSIGADGRVVRPRVLSQRPSRVFARASLSAIERSEFRPATYVAGLPPESRARVRVLHRYRIADSSP